jgi:predicted SnoaL-like aldol condensation-catalyzing enzyme
MSNDHKQKAVDLLKTLETRDPKPFSYINPHKYIQHNLDVGDGSAGVAALAKSLPVDTKVNIVRAFQDGDFVFVHVEYDFFGPKIGFDIFALKVA